MTLRQAAAGLDVERGEPPPIRIGQDQNRVVRRHDHAVGEQDVIRHLPGRAIGVTSATIRKAPWSISRQQLL